MYKLSIFYKKGVKLYKPTEEEVKRRQEEFRKIKLEELTEVAEELLKLNHKKRADGKYDIYGDVYLDNMYLTSLLEVPVKFGKVYGIFSCSNNQLRNLKGAPEYVGKSFWCNHNELISLEGAPEYVGKDFFCYNNQLVSLEGAPGYVGEDFYCWNTAKKFTEEEVRKVVDVKGKVYV